MDTFRSYSEKSTVDRRVGKIAEVLRPHAPKEMSEIDLEIRAKQLLTLYDTVRDHFKKPEEDLKEAA
jgi:hypothetical protein